MKPTPQSETPRTDLEESVGGRVMKHDCAVRSSFARILERELNEAKQQLAELQKDKERLDWFDNTCLLTETILSLHGERDIRIAIDHAMKEQTK